MKRFLLLPLLLLTLFVLKFEANAQNVGISDAAITPDASAVLEVRSTDKGLLIPRVALTQTTVAAPVTTPATSLLVFNTASVNDVTPGFYYWSGSAWIRILSGTVPSSGWALTGNAGTNPASNFLGTTDAQDFVIRTSNTERLRVRATGFVGINTNNPTERLHIEGNVRFSGALMPNNNAGNAGSFLQSQGAGLPPTWSLPGLSVTDIVSVNSTANLCISGAVFTTYPGCTQILTLQAGQRVLAMAEAGIIVSNDCSGTSTVHRSIVDARISINGNDFPNGAWLRTSLDNDIGYVVFNSLTLIGEYTVPANGNYTFELQARRAGGNGNAVSGGDNTSALQATLILIVYTP